MLLSGGDMQSRFVAGGDEEKKKAELLALLEEAALRLSFDGGRYC
jgi:hypothetical protein